MCVMVVCVDNCLYYVKVQRLMYQLNLNKEDLTPSILECALCEGVNKTCSNYAPSGKDAIIKEFKYKIMLEKLR